MTSVLKKRKINKNNNKDIMADVLFNFYSYLLKIRVSLDKIYLFKDFELIGGIMAVLKVKFENILCFNDFEADFSYPKKIVNTTLDNEYLENYPNIRYKKINIIIGSNASGKTCLGKAIWKTLTFLSTKEANPIKEMVNDTKKEAYILLDCVFSNGLFFRLEINIDTQGEIKARYLPHKLRKEDTYEKVLKLLDYKKPFTNYIEALEGALSGGWNVNFPSNEEGFDRILCEYKDEEKQEFCDIYSKLIKVFDPSIEEVFVSKEISDTYVVKFYNGLTVPVTHGAKISGLNRLSSGTKNVVNIAGLIYSIKKQENGLCYADEQFSYVNSDIESACLATMVDLLGDGEQLFFTTHNEDIMRLSFPLHSYNFLKKIRMEDGEYKIELLNASSFEKRNNVSVKNLFDNNYFDVSPDVKDVYSLGE